ncbi:hypothetical protein [Flavobacterium sp.]|uniref:hypothetical protein n=1 Tax=Flavobacterium sp. TaxID=239 RepID=UPI003265C8B0
MKTLKNLFFLLTISIFAVSCSSDDDKPGVTFSEENPVDLYLAASGFNQKSVEVKNSAFYEYGFSFKPKVTGKINALIVKIPDVNTNLKITIWDAATKTVIKTESVPIPTANVTVEKVITAITLTKDKEYFFTINSNDWYNRTKTDGTAAVYPIVAGNITITGYAYIQAEDGVPVFPTNARDTYYAGDMTFKFQQTE